MKKLFTFVFVLFIFSNLNAQTQDTTIYSFTDVPPFAKICAKVVLDQRAKCTNETLLKIIATNVGYPQEAREKGIEGKVFAQFVVEKNGQISNVKIVKGVAELNPAVIAVFELLKKADYFEPASLNGTLVRYQMVLPIAFKLQAPDPVKPYQLIEGDTVYIAPSKDSKFLGGTEALTKFLKEKTPKIKQLDDSCRIGVIQYAVIVKPNNALKIVDTYDFNNLGFDAQYEGIKLINSSATKWEMAENNGIKVNSSQNIRIKFQPNAKKCPNALKNFDAAAKLSEEGLKLIDAQQNEKALELFNKAVALDKRNTEIRYQRGLVEVNLKKNTEACEDLTFVKRELKVNWADLVIKFVCGK